MWRNIPVVLTGTLAMLSLATYGCGTHATPVATTLGTAAKRAAQRNRGTVIPTPALKIRLPAAPAQRPAKPLTLSAHAPTIHATCRPGPLAQQMAQHQHAVHVELYAHNRVVLLPAGIGLRAPRWSAHHDHIVTAACHYPLYTLDHSGTVTIAPSQTASTYDLTDLFTIWGQPLTRSRLASFTVQAPAHVATFINGLPYTRAAPGTAPLTNHAEIVLEIASSVPAHRNYPFS